MLAARRPAASEHSGLRELQPGLGNGVRSVRLDHDRQFFSTDIDDICRPLEQRRREFESQHEEHQNHHAARSVLDLVQSIPIVPRRVVVRRYVRDRVLGNDGRGRRVLGCGRFAGLRGLPCSPHCGGKRACRRGSCSQDPVPLRHDCPPRVGRCAIVRP